MSNSSSEQHMIPHVFGDFFIFQTAEDTVIAGRLIPKGYCNLTHILKAASAETGKNKQWTKYFKTEGAQEFLEELANQNGFCVIENPVVLKCTTPQPLGLQPLIIVIQGGSPHEQGTWGHLEVAIHLACWCCPKLAVWSVKSLRAVIEGDFQALTEEAYIAQLNLQKQWQSIRDSSKEAFWTLGDAIKSYILKHSERSDKFRLFVFSNCQDCVNRGLFGKDASTIREELGVKDLLRDHYGQVALKRIDLIQSLAAASIVHRDVNPMDAVRSALEMYKFEVINYKE